MNTLGLILFVLGLFGTAAIAHRLKLSDEEDEIKQLSSLSLDEFFRLRAFAAGCLVLIVGGTFFAYWRAP